MQIEYKSRGLKKVCTNAREAVKEHGENMAAKIHQRIDEITAAESSNSSFNIKSVAATY